MVGSLSKVTQKTYKSVGRPLLFKLSSDRAHSATTNLSIIAQKVPFASQLTAKTLRFEHKSLNINVAGIDFDNPIGLSAGFDKEAKLPETMHAIGFGLEEVGSITAKTYNGNPKPWYTRLPKSESVLVNSGLRSSGVDNIAQRADKMKPNLYQKMPINASIAKTNSPECNTLEKGIEDYKKSFKRLEKSPWPRMYTINISCPNTSGGEPFNKPDNLKKLLKELDGLDIKRPVFLKLPIDLNWKEIDSLLQVASESFLSGVTIGNLAKDRSVLYEEDAKKIKKGQRGNLSGRPCYEPSNLRLAKAYVKYNDKLLFIGVGGVFSAEDAYAKIKLGASLVELITGMIYEGPALIGQINKGLVELLKRDGYRNISEAIGVDAKDYVASHH